MNKEQQELLDDVYENYSKMVWRITDIPLYGKEEFINKCKTDSEFSETWGLKIEERELSLEERTEYKKKRDGISRTFVSYTHQMLDNSHIPTKLITITYNNEKIESYE
jgi:hypothetical protein